MTRSKRRREFLRRDQNDRRRAIGGFSEETLAKFQEMCAEKQGLDFAEGDTYDFTRCVRPDGEAYGTKGQCKSGKREDKKVAQVGVPIPEGESAEDVLQRLIPKGEKTMPVRQA
jgi:hypothetical protein